MNLREYLDKFDLQYCIAVTGNRFRGDMIPKQVKLREIAPNEIIIEFDTYREKSLQLIKIVKRRLRKHGISYKIYDHGGRSPHIHIYNIIGLQHVDYEIRSSYKKILTNMVAPFEEADVSLSSNGLIAMEDRPHFKHGTVKKLIEEFGDFDNELSLDLLNTAYEIVHHNEELDLTRNTYDNNFVLSWMLSFSGYEHNMDLWLFKNVAITLVNDNYNITEFCDKFGTVYGNTYVQYLYGWIRWAQQHHRYFCLGEILYFCEMYDLDWREVMNEYKQKPYREQNKLQKIIY